MNGEDTVKTCRLSTKSTVSVVSAGGGEASGVVNLRAECRPFITPPAHGENGVAHA